MAETQTTTTKKKRASKKAPARRQPAADNGVSLPPGEQEQSVILNNAEVRAAVAKGVRELVKLKGERDSINADMNAVRKAIYARGVNRRALARVVQDFEMEQHVRDETELGHAIGRQALGIPVQTDAFATIDPVQH